MTPTPTLARSREQDQSNDTAPTNGAEDTASAVRALLIPSDEALPVREVTISDLESIQALVEGDIQAINLGEEPRATVYLNEEGKMFEHCKPNPRAQRLLGKDLLDGDYIVGPVVIAGFDPETGENEPLNDGVHDRLSAPDALAARTLRPPDNTVELGRTLKYEWVDGDPDEQGVQQLMVLTVTHTTEPRNQLSAYVIRETSEPLARGSLRGLHLGTGCALATQELARYSTQQRDRFAVRALARLQALFEAGENRITALISDPPCTARV
jgi:hypothetical protein